MADFFDRLLARAVPGYPVPGDSIVTPRLPQLFEPAPPEPETVEPVVVPPPGPRGAAGRTGPPGPRGLSGETPVVAPAPPAMPAAEHPAPAPERVTETHTVSSHEVRVTEQVRERVVEPHVITTSHTTVLPGEVRIAELRPVHTTVVAPVPVPPPVVRPSVRQVAVAQPEVRVSIGRIEVTAPPPTTQAAPRRRSTSRRPAPQVSLESYLRREDDRR